MIQLIFHTRLTTNSLLAYYSDPHLLILHNGHTLNIYLGLKIISFSLQKIVTQKLNILNDKKLVLTSSAQPAQLWLDSSLVLQ